MNIEYGKLTKLLQKTFINAYIPDDKNAFDELVSYIVEDNNEELIKNDIYKFLDEFYFCEEKNNFREPSQIVQIIPDKNQFIVNCHCTVHGRVNLSSFTNGMFKWGKVEGHCVCSGSSKLKSLEGSPEYVGGNFNCSMCTDLKSLEGAPEVVDGAFRCGYCSKLTSLKGAPKYVGGEFDCHACSITSLEGAPKRVEGDINCGYCPSLKSLKGAPKYVGGNFKCSNCRQLTTKALKDIEKQVKGMILRIKE